MHAFPHSSSFRRLTVGAALALTTLTSSSYADENRYQQHNLVTDGGDPNITADHTDPNLVNAWGLVFGYNTPAWVADNGTGVSTLYNGDGVAILFPPPKQLVVSIPQGGPTGIVFNNNNSGNAPDFLITNALTSAGLFIFASESGVISAWAPSVDLNNAVAKFTTDNGAVYKGLAIGGNGSGHFLYATDFHNGIVDVFDKGFTRVTDKFPFTDPTIPAGFAPFGIQNILGDIYVTYAKQDAAKHDDVHRRGLGYVNVFDANGNLLHRVASRGALNAPWGLALAPAGFGKFRGRLLIGNFGDGTIGAYSLTTGEFQGRLRNPNDRVLKIDGLWALSFGNGVQHQPANTLFFTAGPGDEMHGLYGRIEPIP